MRFVRVVGATDDDEDDGCVDVGLSVLGEVLARSIAGVSPVYSLYTLPVTKLSDLT